MGKAMTYEEGPARLKNNMSKLNGCAICGRSMKPFAMDTLRPDVELVALHIFPPVLTYVCKVRSEAYWGQAFGCLPC